jgi:hypothetical protein
LIKLELEFSLLAVKKVLTYFRGEPDAKGHFFIMGLLISSIMFSMIFRNNRLLNDKRFRHDKANTGTAGEKG